MFRALCLLRMGTACSFQQRQKIRFISMVNGEDPHLHFLSKLTILILGKGLSQRVPLSHHLGHVVGKLKPSLCKIMHPMHRSWRMGHYLILGILSLLTGNRITTHFLICWLISVPLTGSRKKLSPMSFHMERSVAGCGVLTQIPCFDRESS